VTEKTLKHFEVLVVGAGPAGLATAASAANAGANVGVLDDNPDVGGQIWRNERSRRNSETSKWATKLSAGKAEVLCGTTVVHHDLKSQTIFAEQCDGLFEVGFSKLIIATGARERFLPFPGWTLPNVMAAGGLQAMVKSGLPIAGKRVVLAGTGPLLLAVAAYLRKHGANVLVICEQTSRNALIGFAASLFRQPGKLAEALAIEREIRPIPFWSNSWPVRALGNEKLNGVILSRSGKLNELACDYLACGFHLVPNIELASLLGCRLKNGYVEVDQLQQTSVPDVFCAGEPTGIGGLEISLIEGQIAGLAATGKAGHTQDLRRKWQRSQSFAKNLERAFRLRPELKALPDRDTIVCRCEDVTHGRLAQYKSWRDAKNQTRCGMGPCQGRVCGPATQFLYGWQQESIRPPILPVRLQNLAGMVSAQSKSTGEFQ
jgi:NADPH-dependent 2,4-dienoyl-CoA reductase/sulfur reductase-like enzyme